MKKILILLILVFQISCAASQKEKNQMPNWITNPYSEYNQTFYIVTVGSGDTKKAAEQDAQTGISKIIEMKIESNETLQQNYLEQSGKDIESREELNKLTNIQTEQTLKNIKIAKTFIDPTDALHYALAYLDRAATSLIYEKEIGKNNSEIKKFYNQYQKTDDKIQKFKLLKKSHSLTEQNQYLNDQLRIISSVGQTVELPYSMADLESEKMSLASTIEVEIIADGDYPESVETYLSHAFNNIGFTVLSSSSKEADFVVKADLSIQKANLQRENLVFVNWELVVKLIKKDGEQNEVTFTKTGRNGQVNLQQARRRAVQEVEKVAKQDLIDFFNKKF